MAITETDWKVAAREIWIFQLGVAQAEREQRRERGEHAAPRSANSSAPGARVK